MSSFLDRLKKRKIVQWALAYVTGAWAMLSALDILGPWGLPDYAMRAIQVIAFIGFLATLVIAWYHGEKDRQRVSGVELLLLAMLFALGGGMLSMLETPEDAAATGETSPALVAAGADAVPVRVGVILPREDGRSTDRYSPRLIQELFSSELARRRGLAVVDPLSLSTLLESEQRRSGSPYSTLASADIPFAVRLTTNSTPSGTDVGFSLVETNGGEVVHSGSFLARDEAEVATKSATAVAEMITSLEEKVGYLSKSADIEPWLADGSANVEAVRAFLQGINYTYHDLPGGTEHFQRAVALDPNFAAPRVWLVAGLVRAGDSAQARSHLDVLGIIGERAPPFDQAMIGWAEAYLDGRLEEQQRHLQAALALSPRNNVLLYNLGVVLYRLGRPAEAVEVLREPVQLRWRFPRLYVLWGVVSIQAGMVDGLRPTLEYAFDIAPQDAYLTGLLEALARFEGDTMAARRHGEAFRRRVGSAQREAAFEEMAPIYTTLAELARQRDDLRRSAALLQHARDADPDDPIVRLELARVEWLRGSKATALALYEEVAADQSAPEVIYLLGDVARELGREYEAKHHLRRYLKLSPTGPYAFRAREMIRQLDGSTSSGNGPPTLEE